MTRPVPAETFDALRAMLAVRGGDCSDILDRQHAVIEAMGVAVCTTDAEGRLTFYNDAAAALWGWAPPLREQRWCGAWRLLSPDGTPLPHERSAVAATLRGGAPVPGDWAWAERPDGTRLAFAPFASVLRDADGQLAGAVNLLVELSDLAGLTERRLRAAQEMSPEAFMLATPVRDAVGEVADLRLDYANPAAARLFGRDRPALAGATLRSLIPDAAEAATLLRDCAGVLAGGEALPRKAEYGLGGRRHWLRSRVTPLGDGVALAIEDVTEMREAAARLHRLALHDRLTGLPNRAALQDRMAQALQGGAPAALLLLDLDDFRVTNDALGHDVGDALLRGAAARLGACLDGDGLVARLEADEFAVLLQGPDPGPRAEAVARRIGEAIAAPFILGDYRAHIGVTTGIALAGPGEAPPEALLRQASLALSHARAEARGGWRVFVPRMAAEREAQARLRAELAEALPAGEVALHYQPIFALADNRPTAMEALMRWTHPRRGPVSPAEFIPVAEQTGLILGLGAWALRQACADAARWPGDIKVSVNLSAVQFHGGAVAEVVRAALGAAGLAPQRLELEITESVLLQQNDAVLSALRELRALGVGIALDDFGTGFASLSYLRAFPFDKIKIDQSFVRDAVCRPECRAIVQSVAQLAAELGMVSTAEGVEGPGQMAMVRRIGCVEAQGYHLGRPAPIAALGRLLAR